MSIGKKYFKLRLKSNLKVFPVILIITVLVFSCLASAAVIALNTNSDDSGKQKIKIGVTGNLENTYLEAGLYALQNMDSSKYYFEFVQMEEKEAEEKLNNREISGYLRIPEGFVRGVATGENIPAEYITLNAPDNFGTIISEEVTKIVSDMLSKSQAGIYSMQDVARKYKNNNMWKNTNRLTEKYALTILSRENIYTVSETGITDSLSLGGYYICGIVVLFMLLWGISCNRIFSSEQISFSRMLKISGMNTGKQVRCEYFAYLVVTMISIVIFAIVFGTVNNIMNLQIPEIEGVGVFKSVVFAIGLIPVTAMIAMMQTAFYEMVTNKIGAVLVLFILAIGMGYISGCFYPTYFFPEIVQNFAAVLPVGAGFSYIRKIMSGTLPVTEILAIVAYTVLFFYLTVWKRNRRMEGDSV